MGPLKPWYSDWRSIGRTLQQVLRLRPSPCLASVSMCYSSAPPRGPLMLAPILPGHHTIRRLVAPCGHAPDVVPQTLLARRVCWASLPAHTSQTAPARSRAPGAGHPRRRVMTSILPGRLWGLDPRRKRLALGGGGRRRRHCPGPAPASGGPPGDDMPGRLATGRQSPDSLCPELHDLGSRECWQKHEALAEAGLPAKQGSWAGVPTHNSTPDPMILQWQARH